jgi:hypothetical protein
MFDMDYFNSSYAGGLNDVNIMVELFIIVEQWDAAGECPAVWDEWILMIVDFNINRFSL